MLIYFLALLFLLVIAYLIFFLLDLRKITQQLSYIVKEETNAELVSTTKISLIRQLLDRNNELIRKNKHYYQEQRKKEKELHQLLSNLTHDLKTPLTVASGYTQLLSKKANTQENQEIIKKIDSSLISISHYLGYLMECNLIQEKSMTLDLEELDLSELLRENLLTFYEEFEEAKLSLSVDIAETGRLISDRIVLQRIFQNLIGNMIKHGYQVAEVKLFKESEAWVISFRNEIERPIVQAEQLFERFVTEDASRNNKSTGLGLHIVKELLELLDGEIQLETDESTFELIIKLKSCHY